MKKIFAIVLAICLLTTCAITVRAVGSISLKGPSTVRAGDTITLTFSAGGGIYGGSGSVSFNSSQLTLKKYEKAIGGDWVVEFSGNSFVFYDNSMSSPIVSGTAIFKASFVVNQSLAKGAELAVTVKGVKLSDGNKDISMGSRTYKKTIAPPLSGNCKLASLKISNAKLSPKFSPDVTSYTVEVPFTTEKLKITAKAEHSGAKVTVKKPKLKAGATTKVTVTVKAENGTVKTYTIKAKRAQDPNYVPSQNANLKELTVEGVKLSPVFSPEVTGYYLWLPYEMDALTVNAVTEDKNATVQIGDATKLEAGKPTDISVTVTAENGTQQIYTLTAFRAPAHEDTEEFLGCREPETQPTVPEPETQPKVLEQGQLQQPAQPQLQITMLQIILLTGVGVVCLSTGILLGVWFKHLSYKRRNKEVTQ